MHQYDTVLKSLLQSSANSILERIAGVRVTHWLNVELPQVQQTRVDLLGDAENGELIHVELQSTNDPQMPLRMAEYSLRVYRQFQRFPRQILLYVGEEEMRMAAELTGPQHVCRYTIVDLRELDSQPFLDSPLTADWLIAILTNLRDRKAAVRQILERIDRLQGQQRDMAFTQLSILSGLRKLGKVIREEVHNMPILTDILDHDLLGPILRQGIEQGLQQGKLEGEEQGRQEGKQAGRQEGEILILRRLIEKRFGGFPSWVEERLTKLSTSDLEDMAIRILESRGLEDLFAPPAPKP